MQSSDEILKVRISTILPILDERQKRIYLSAEAKSIGWGGVTEIAELSSVSRRTISKKDMISTGTFNHDRVRKAGGGRKSQTEHYPELLATIEKIVSPHTMGDPTNPLIWTSKSIRKITRSLNDEGFTVCHEVTRKCLIKLNYSLQANKKTKEGGNHPDRDSQFEFINEKTKDFISSNDPVISVDCKKKELIGEYKNSGQEWAGSNSAIDVNVYDFINKAKGKASPYGVYDIQNNTGWVNVGVSRASSD